MARKEPSPIDVYQLLPKTNCGQCGEQNCLAFATKVVSNEVQLEKCAPLFTKEHERAHKQLEKVLRPAVREVIVGSGEHATKIGGKHVMHRHEFTYANPTAIAIDVTDDMAEAELLDRVKRVEDFHFEFIGHQLKLDMIAIRSTTGEPEKFKATTQKVVENTKLPIILCSFNPQVVKAGLAAAEELGPLLYAATEHNWKEMAELALQYHCPLAVFAPNNLKLLKSLVKTLLQHGVENIVLDPGTSLIEGLGDTLSNFTMIRRSVFEAGDELLGFPLMGVPMIAWTQKKSIHEDVARWKEAYLAAMLIVRFADIIVMHNVSGWALLPLVTLRQNIYADPRKPMTVHAGLKAFGNPNGNSPVMFTTNFALTYYTVASDLESAKTDAYLIVIDTGGIAVDSSVAGRRLTPEKVASALKSSGIERKVKHRKIVIPGKAARLANEIEELSGWQVLVGPKDSSDIPKFLQEKWVTRT